MSINFTLDSETQRWIANDKRKIELGNYHDPQNPEDRRELSYKGERHHFLIGPNGSGKGMRVLVRNLLRTASNRSFVVFDTKGELTAITAAYRRQVSDVVILNPFGVLGIPGSSFNPLALIDPRSDNFFDDCAGIAEALIKIEEKEPHWSESAMALLTALIMWETMIAKREKRPASLVHVRKMLTEPDVYEAGENGKQLLVSGLRVTAKRMAEEGGERVKSMIGRFTRGTDEMASIQSTADRQTTWTLSTPIAKSLMRNEIDFAVLKKRPTTVYVILPPERMQTHSVWLRTVLVTALRSLFTAGGLRTLFMIDEFAHLGHLRIVEDVFALIRGYGIQMMPVVQSIPQLHVYKKWQAMLGSAGVVQCFAPNDIETAEWMSKRAGDTTVVASGYNAGNSDSEHRHSANNGRSWQQARRPLFTPNELIGMERGTGLIFLDSTTKTIPFHAPPYWDIDLYRERAQPNPYYQG